MYYHYFVAVNLSYSTTIFLRACWVSQGHVRSFPGLAQFFQSLWYFSEPVSFICDFVCMSTPNKQFLDSDEVTQPQVPPNEGNVPTGGSKDVSKPMIDVVNPPKVQSKLSQGVTAVAYDSKLKNCCVSCAMCHNVKNISFCM